MSYKFSKKSIKKLETCHEDLRAICEEVIRIYDFSVLHGYRDEYEQNWLFSKGRSEKKFPDSKHNSSPSLAIDIAPYPIDFKKLKRFYYLAGLFNATAYHLMKLGLISHEIRWGGDWNRNNVFSDQSFNDLGHFELI